MFHFDEIPMPTLGHTGLDGLLSEEEKAIQEVAHRFAKDVVRPIGEELDKVTPEEVVAPESPLWTFFSRLKESGILDLETIFSLSSEEKARMMPIIFEEFGWGDSGLTICALATSFTPFAAYGTGDPELIERFGDLIGTWVGTLPDRGSDMVDIDKTESLAGSKSGPRCLRKFA